jgi:NAD(P)-dependent dehydrogenase (short-subunit alcohol dehydrogenase family)
LTPHDGKEDKMEGMDDEGSSTPMEPILGDQATPWDPADPDVAGRADVNKLPDDFCIPGRFAGRTVIVTGAARGLGAMAARRLAREGANVVGVDILEETGAATIAAIVAEGGRATFVAGDIADDATSAEMVRVAVETYGGLDAAINNAGVVDALNPEEPIDFVNQKDKLLALIHEAGDDYWHRVMAVNATGVFYSMRHELRQFMKQGRGGAIVNVSSVAGIIGFGSTCSYVASKHAVQGLTKTAAIDYAPFGIRVNSVGMHVMMTPMLDRSMETINQRQATGFKDTGLGLYKSMSLQQYSDQKKRGCRAHPLAIHAQARHHKHRAFPGQRARIPGDRRPLGRAFKSGPPQPYCGLHAPGDSVSADPGLRARGQDRHQCRGKADQPGG